MAPAARVLTGTTGSALVAFAGLKRRDKLGAALGAVGLGLLAHGLANPDVKGLAGRVARRAKNAKNGKDAKTGKDSFQAAEPSGSPAETPRDESLHPHSHQHAAEPALQPVS